MSGMKNINEPHHFLHPFEEFEASYIDQLLGINALEPMLKTKCCSNCP
jgi:hypothetical protein